MMLKPLMDVGMLFTWQKFSATIMPRVEKTPPRRETSRGPDRS